MKASHDVLRRKLRVESSMPEEAAISPARAVRVALARAADQAFSLALRAGSIRQSRLDLADVVEHINETWALFPVSHDDGEVGAICVNPAACFAFVEQQTMGQVRPDAAPDRTLTSTDRALTQPLSDLFLRLFDETLEGAPTAFWTQGYRCEDPVPTRHLLALQLEALEYRVFDVTMEFVGTDRHGQLLLILPIKAKAMKQAKLEDLTGTTSIPVHLGQLHGARAVRLISSGSGQGAAAQAISQGSGVALPKGAPNPADAPSEIRANPQAARGQEPVHGEVWPEPSRRARRVVRANRSQLDLPLRSDHRRAWIRLGQVPKEWCCACLTRNRQIQVCPPWISARLVL